MTEKDFEMLATQAWFIMFGVSVGAALVDFRSFWWLPLFIIVVLVVYRIYVYFMFCERRVRK
ncbi:hypothetical protein DOK76_12710 [Vagococcus sp. DIV0080]|uniref:Uncharacterized protein n=1 Tax=Candidatus Vagococcus giribetii TaxID=2230876 RepID=A0ABS3HVZ4_9ENTE|nr:hypothetical protein [Vagococcus sp. DIV0080]MBO0477927.1 hypothetical protein [Vagococcus sp. DIV0080]